VKQISATSFTEAIDLMACLAVLREGESLVASHAFEAANAPSQQPSCKKR
jgi:hypothetical protein